jgi:hypothetical protein
VRLKVKRKGRMKLRIRMTCSMFEMSEDEEQEIERG